MFIFFSLGVINFQNGDKYRGDFKDGRPNGYGTMKYSFSLPGMNGANLKGLNITVTLWPEKERDKVK